MALFGKKKKAEPAAPPIEEQDEIRVVGGDADEFDADESDGGQSIDFDAIAAELEDNNGESAIGAPLGDATTTAATAPDDFGSTADFASGTTDLNAADDLDFDAVFDDGAPVVAAPAEAFVTGENPFGAEMGAATPASDMPTDGIAIEPVSDTPPLTYTAPLLTSDAVATAGVPATRKSFPLPMILGALGLLLALGAVGYLVTRGGSAPDTAPVVAASPPLRAPATGAAAIELVNQRAAVDGVPIAPGAVRAAPALSGPRPTVPLTPTLLKQLQDLWKQGAAAKQRGDIAGARAAWTKMLRLRPNHPGVQSAIDKLPAA